MEIKELILKYGILLSRRFNKKEKIRFLQAIKADCEQIGWKISFQRDRKKRSEATNLIVGDLKRAKYVIVVHYDTPPKQFFQKEDLPFDGVKSIVSKYLNESIPLIILSFFAFFGFTTIGTLTLEKPIAFLFYGVIALILLYGLLKLIRGYPERHNLQKNSAAVCVALSLLDEESKDIFAIAFTDQECINHHGDMILSPLVKNKVVIHLSHFCTGDSILLTSTKQNLAIAKQLSSAFSHMEVTIQEVGHDQIQHHSLKSYPISVSLMLTKKKGKKEVVIANGKRADTDIDINLLENVAKCLKNSLSNVSA